MDFAQNLSALMERKGVSAYRMSVDLEISDSLIGYWRRGQKMPGAKNIAKLASYFGVSTDYLLGKTDFPYPDLSGKTMSFQPVAEGDEEIWHKKNGPTLITEDGPTDPLDARLTDLLHRATPEQKKAWIALLESMQPEQ